MPKPTVLQKLTNILSNSNDITGAVKRVNSYEINTSDILFKTKNRDEYETKLTQLKQQQLMAKQWKRANYELTNKSLAGLNEVKMMYRDADLMDCFPEIGAALDIVSEEACLEYSTRIKLLNGKITTIGELFDKNYRNFWVYSIDEYGKCKPSLIEKVIYKGKRPLYQITLNDGTIIKCTKDHLFLTTNNEWVKADSLSNNDSLMSIYEKIDKKGYEKIKSSLETKFTHTHRIVAENTMHDIKLKLSEKNGMFGVHRYDKLNPNYHSEYKHIEDIDENEYIKYVISCGKECRDKISKRFNLQKTTVINYNSILCKRYGVQKIFQLSYIFDDNKNIKKFRELIHNGYTKKCQIEKLMGIERHKLNNYVKILGYKNWNDAIENIDNHRIISIEKCNTYGKVYDLYNSSVNHCYAIKCNEGHIISHNCYIPKNGFMVNVTSKSERVKSILEDLLVNRLQINIMIPMICRSMCKYGNTFLLLDIDTENGVTNWRQLPVYEVERYENGMENPYASAYVNLNNIDLNKTDSTKFVWVGQTNYIPYRNWQIAHFRLLYDSLFLPYGVSYLQKARRHWRLLSMMEDMMLIYRLERSIERRVFKINVGNIDDADVPAYINEIANNFKRTPIIDPMTGQLDLKKNLLNVSEDYFIPVRDDNAANPIDTLQGAQNLTAIDDIKFIQNKVLTALRIPKSFLNFDETTGEGKNLSLMDVRFTRTVNRVQQALLMELNKICIIHLYLLGFEDDLTNFNLTMNNPSSQAEMLELENMAKKVTTAKDAISDAGNGIQLMSWTRACKEIMGWSDKEIEDNLEEIRLEKALAAELEKTSQIIKRTGLFDKVDNIYGEPGAEYSENQPDENGEPGAGGTGGGGGLVGGSDLDFGDENGGEETGEEGEMDMNTASNEETASGEEGGEGNIPETGNETGTVQSQQSVGESHLQRMLKNIITEQRQMRNDIVTKKKKYTVNLKERKKRYDEVQKNRIEENVPIYQKNFLINKDLDGMIKQLSSLND